MSRKYRNISSYFRQELKYLFFCDSISLLILLKMNLLVSENHIQGFGQLGQFMDSAIYHRPEEKESQKEVMCVKWHPN